MATLAVKNQAMTRWFFPVPPAVTELFQRIRIGYDAVTGAFRAWSR